MGKNEKKIVDNYGKEFLNNGIRRWQRVINEY